MKREEDEENLFKKNHYPEENEKKKLQLQTGKNMAVSGRSSQEKRPKDWTAEERISAIIKTGCMTEEDRTAWCRKKGVFIHNLDQWKKDAISAMIPKANKEQIEEHRNLKKEISTLKKDLSRKDKALAETAALLILKKKPRRSGGRQRKIDQSRR